MKQIVENAYVVKPHNPNIVGCCVYMVDTKSDEGLVLIDVGLEIDPIQEIEKDGFDLKDVKHCLITHGHLDHIGACHRLKEINEDIKFYAHELDAEKIEYTPKNQFTPEFYANYEYNPVKIFKRIKVDNEILIFGQLEFKCIHIPGHTPGSVAYLLEIGEKKILFAGDLPGVVLNKRGGDLDSYLKSLPKLLEFNIDILCEGHEDIIKPAKKVSKFIKGYMKLNENLNIILEDPNNTKALLELTLIAYDLEFYENALDFCNYLLEIEPENVDTQQILKKIKKHNPPKIEFLKRLINESINTKIR